MGKLKALPVRNVIRILKKFKFYRLRRGRHDIYHNKEKNITVPVPTSHSNVTKGVIKSLIRQTGIPKIEFTN
ncbi:MAG: type II toxin-antitoxin system HicA family toxin [archaeon]|nr:MAG: type II toxin-antitoxin system HicA family toxin [archaeon]